jgi:Lysyl oxidase
VPLPAWGITVDNGKKYSFLDFSATVWDAGPAPMVIEGFRRLGTNIMDAFEYFYRDGRVVGRAPAGTLRYDSQPGHEHWHFQQFASYTLLDSSMVKQVASHKTGFCLAPTDGIDLTVPGALWRPDSLGFFSQCGDQNAIWTRETLPSGWGDTYQQALPGQSFNITDLPNGTYCIQIQANPLGQIQEVSTTNDITYRQVILGGTAGVRQPHFQAFSCDAGTSGLARALAAGSDRARLSRSAFQTIPKITIPMATNHRTSPACSTSAEIRSVR